MGLDRLVQALRRQRATVEDFLREAGVAPIDAEILILNAIADVSEEEWRITTTTDRRKVPAN